MELLELFGPAAGAEVRAAEQEDAVDGIMPRVVVRPRDAQAVARVLGFAAEHGLATMARGGETAIGIGNPPARLDMILDITANDQVFEYRPRDLTITVGAGAAVAEVQRVLDEHQQMLALDPPLPERATVGGSVAANSTGPRGLRYGTARDLVIGSEAALADGTLMHSGGRVVKNVAGYDMNKLLVGSFGTLAVITRLTFKLLPQPPERGLIVAVFDDVAAAHAAAMTITNSTLAPLSLDLLSPSATIALADELPPGHPDGWLLVVEFAGALPAVERSRAELFAITRAHGHIDAADAAHGARERLVARLRDFGHGPEAAPLTLRASVLPSEVARVCTIFVEVARTEAVPVGLVARAGNGVVYSYWPLTDPTTIHALVGSLRGRLSELKGNLVVERCPTDAKRRLDAWGIDGADVALMRRVKQAFDPAALLAPGRLL